MKNDEILIEVIDLKKNDQTIRSTIGFGVNVSVFIIENGLSFCFPSWSGLGIQVVGSPQNELGFFPCFPNL